MNSTGVDNYFYSPTEVTKEKINPVDNYGSELSPFYIVLINMGWMCNFNCIN